MPVYSHRLGHNLLNRRLTKCVCVCFFLRVFYLFPSKRDQNVRRCAHARCSYLSEITQTHINTYMQGSKYTSWQQRRRTHVLEVTHTNAHTNFKPSGVSRLISDCSPLSFQPSSPLPLSRLCVCLSFCLQSSLSFPTRPLPPPDPPLLPLSRWG